MGLLKPRTRRIAKPCALRLQLGTPCGRGGQSGAHPRRLYRAVSHQGAQPGRCPAERARLQRVPSRTNAMGREETSPPIDGGGGGEEGL
eukprot:6970344-Pyramimonas_sp.AAC.1